jgi:hypothetical protein
VLRERGRNSRNAPFVKTDLAAQASREITDRFSIEFWREVADDWRGFSRGARGFRPEKIGRFAVGFATENSVRAARSARD